MAIFNSLSSLSAISAQASNIAAVEFLIPASTIKRTDKNGAFVDKIEAEISSRRERLSAFLSANQISPLPAWGNVLLEVMSGDRTPRMPRAFYQAMECLGVQWYGQRITRKGAQVTQTGTGLTIHLETKFKSLQWSTEINGEMNISFPVHCLPARIASHMAKQFSILTPGQYAELASIFCPKADVEGAVITIVSTAGESTSSSKVIFNFDTKEVKARSTRKANEVMEISDTHFDSKFALFILACEIANYGSNSGVNSTLNELPNMWERSENYGVTMKSSDPTRVILDNLCLPIAFVPTRRGVFPFLTLANEQFNCTSLAGIKEPVAVDKLAKKWLTFKKGAMAMMLGRNGDIVLNPHDGGKAAKEYNRPTQGMKFLKADSPNRIESGLKIDLGDGSYAIPEGTMLMTAFTNSRLGAGSGVSFIKEGTLIQYQVEKTITGEVTTLRVPSAIRVQMAKMPGGLFTNLKTAVQMQCEKLVGKSFPPGEVILALFKGRYEIVRNSNHNQTLKVKSFEIVDMNTIEGRADSFQVKFTVVLDECDDMLKLRNMGIKLTTCPYPVIGLRDDWQLILNNETAKGKLGLVHLFANLYGGTYYPNDGMLILDKPCEIQQDVKIPLVPFDKQIIDLKQEFNAFTQWVSEVTEIAHIQLPIEKTEWEFIKLSHPDADDIKVLMEYETYVMVEERIQVIYGLLPYEVEISTPRENTGTSSLTLEQLAALSLQNKELAELIWEESREYQQTVKDLANTVLAVGVENFTQINVSTLAGREQLREAMKVDEEFANDRELMRKMEQTFPKGIVLSSTYKDDVNFVMFKPSVISRMGTFFGTSASGISLDVVSFISYLLDAGLDNESGIDSLINSWVEKLNKSLEAWFNSLVKSNGVLKKLGRTASILVNGKVKTSYHPMLSPIDGLPVVVLHPDCAITKLLKVTDGDVIGVGRTPMPFVTSCIVRLSASVGRVGHMLIGPYVWSAGNEGDSDGDGIFAINLTKRKVTRVKAREMNAHNMGQGGYSLVYGADLANQPYADFCSYKDKWGKKAVNKVGVICRQIYYGQYVQGAILVSNHYSFGVGISYGICSVLTFKTANMKYAGASAETLRINELATVVAWRRIYEGLGLAGYSAEAAEFFEILRVISWNDKFQYATTKEGKIDFVDNVSPAQRGEIMDGISKLIELAGITHMADAKEIMISIVKANQTRMGISRMEMGKKVSDATLWGSALFGALRRMGQGAYGLDPMDELSSEAAMMADEEGVKPSSTYSMVKGLNLTQHLACPFLKEALTSGVDIHFNLAVKEVEAEEDMGEGSF